MIDKKTMWKVITVTMVALAVSIVVTAVGGGIMLVGEMISVEDIDRGEQSDDNETEPSFITNIYNVIVNVFSPADKNEEDVKDTKAPTIKAAKENVVIYTGSTVSYRSFVKVSDNSDGECTLSIDSSAVNQNVPGEYVVKYVATDPSGNKSKTFSLKVVVKDATYSEDNLMKLIAQKAKAELGYTKEEAKASGKTKVQIVKDIYNYVNNPSAGKNDANIYFNDISNTPAQAAQGGQKSRNGWETDWVEEAYRTLSMTRMKGDCYSYYAVSKAFFEYFEIENMGIQRAVSANESGTHYWNIVKVEEGWYYFDATRLGGTFADGGRNACLITEAKLLGYRTSKGGTEFYKIDKWAGFPTISTKTVS